MISPNIPAACLLRLSFSLNVRACVCVPGTQRKNNKMSHLIVCVVVCPVCEVSSTSAKDKPHMQICDECYGLEQLCRGSLACGVHTPRQTACRQLAESKCTDRCFVTDVHVTGSSLMLCANLPTSCRCRWHVMSSWQCSSVSPPPGPL